MAPPPDPIASLRVALRGHYEIEREIGQGAFATVYLARDLKHERKVALKVLHADPSSETGELRFIREIRLLARLQHPNILPLHDSGHVETLLYYVMPYVAGETLRARIDRERQLPWETACNLARDAADALSYAHGQGIIHRDIKPENILLSAGHPILADFGIARVIDLAGVRQLTRTGMGSPGTPAYMSPEQLMGDRELDGRSDTYSLGCVLYEMLAGRPPFVGKDGFVKRFTEPPAQLPRHDLPDWLQRAVTKALAPSPQDRHQTAAEFIAAISPGGADVVVPNGKESAPILIGSTAAPRERSTDESPHRGLAKQVGGLLRKRPRAAAVAGAGLLVAVAAGAFLWRGLRTDASGRSTVNASRLVILPLAASSDARLLASSLSDGLYDALGREWDGLQVVEASQVDELTRKNGGPPATQSEALEIARQLGAGKAVWGQLLPGSRIRATLYDVPTGRSEREVSFDRAPDQPEEFARLGAELLKVPGRPAAADGGDGGTRSFPAWQAYGLGHLALIRWDLPGAETQFTNAVEADPAFAAAQLWLAQTRALRSYNPVESWIEHVARALAAPGRLQRRDSALAVALGAMGAENYGDACNAYQQLTVDDARDYLAWYGLGLCGLADKALVTDGRRADAWQFRSSYSRAAQAFDRATQLEPRLFAVLPFDSLLRVAPIRAAQLRIGVTADKSKRIFLAYPSLIADTLAYTPFPLAEVQGGRLQTTPKTAGLAAQQNRAFLRRVVLRWIREFPQSAEAQEALSIVQEAAGELSADRGGVPSALTAVLNAQRLTSSDVKRAQFVVSEVRLRLKREEFDRARALADSLLTSSATRSLAAEKLAGLAALTGKLSLAQRLLPVSAVFVGAPDPSKLPNEAIMSAAGALFVRASLGVCSTDFDSLATQINNLLESYAPLRQQQSLREAVTEQAWSIATPCRPAFALRVRAPVDRLVRMQQALARSDRNLVRAEFDSLNTLRENDRPGDVSPDVMYQEAWLLAAVGDTAAAVRRLDLSLSALPTWGNLILDHVPQAAGIVRAMMLRADLALATGDRPAAKKWGQAASALWANAEAPLQSDVRRMRSMSQQSTLSSAPDPLSRR